MPHISDVEGRYLQQLLNNTPEGCSIIHFVGDMYDAPMEKDLKYDERLRRCQHSSDIFVPRDSVPIPLWNAFKSNTTNKMNLLHYLQDSWIKHYCRLPEGIHHILGGLRRKMSVLITNKGVEQIPSLSSCDHEEADTRIFAHVCHSVNAHKCSRMVIDANDTDIIMMALYYSNTIAGLRELWVKKMASSFPATQFVTTSSRSFHQICHPFSWPHMY